MNCTRPVAAVIVVLATGLGGACSLQRVRTPQNPGEADLVMLLPGIIALPVFAMIPCLSGRVIPFSQPPNVRKATTRMMYYIGSMVTAAVIAGLAAFARSKGWLAALLIVETIVAGTVYFTMRHTVDRARWASLE